MARFEVKVVRIESSEKHPSAEKLTINRVGGYVAVTNIKDGGTNEDESLWRFHAGDLAVYVPENAVVPEDVLKLYGYWNEAEGKGFLGGPLGDRVRPVKLRGVYSEGLLFPLYGPPNHRPDAPRNYLVRERHRPYQTWVGNCNPGDDVSAFLGITKYQPTIPPELLGKTFYVEGLPDFDVDPFEKYIRVIAPGEPVVVTEKLHGVMLGISFIPELREKITEESPLGILVYSKGMGAQGLAFNLTEVNAGNTYVRAINRILTKEKVELFWKLVEASGRPVHLLGEMIGPGIQKKYNYGLKQPELRLFDAYSGDWNKGRFLGHDEMEDLVSVLDIKLVPLVYTGPFDQALLESLRDGKDRIANLHTSEGLVVRLKTERHDLSLGRVILKMVNPAYKLKTDGTELS